MSEPRGPAYRLETERLVLRCYEPSDAAAVKEAVDESIEHLTPWIPWIRDEPQTLEQKVTLMRKFRGDFDLGKDRVYGIFERSEARTPRLVGGAGHHARSHPHIEIGYWLRRGETGQGYATEASAALVRTAFEIDGLDRVEIRVDPENTKSAAVAERLGFTNEGTLRGNMKDPDGLFDSQIWGLLATEYEGTPAAATLLVAHDALGRRLV